MECITSGPAKNRALKATCKNQGVQGEMANIALLEQERYLTDEYMVNYCRASRRSASSILMMIKAYYACSTDLRYSILGTNVPSMVHFGSGVYTIKTSYSLHMTLWQRSLILLSAVVLQLWCLRIQLGLVSSDLAKFLFRAWGGGGVWSTLMHKALKNLFLPISMKLSLSAVWYGIPNHGCTIKAKIHHYNGFSQLN